MIKNIKSILKRALIISICIITLGNAIISTASLAYGDSSSLLGTNNALGSPILNENFTLDNWNKWEIVCWGVYLSNFCVPCVDTYRSAFQTGCGGSNGSGLQTLKFGSGNDPSNNETLKSLLNYAIQQEEATTKQIYVAYTELADSQLANSVDVNTDEGSQKLRAATFNDLFFTGLVDGASGNNDNATDDADDASSVTHIKITEQGGSGNYYTNIVAAKEGQIPTFYIKSKDNKYIPILDYRDPYDVQVISLMGASLVNKNDSIKTEFCKNIVDLYTNKAPIALDTFGNITANGYMVLPSSVNQNITTEKKINLLNSFVMSNYTNTYKDDKYVCSIRQYTDGDAAEDKWYSFFGASYFRNGGWPGVSNSELPNATPVIYYDLDTIMYQKYGGKPGDSSEFHYGKTVKELFNCDIESTSNKYQFKIELAGKPWYNGYKGISIDSDTVKDTLASTQVASSMLSNQFKQNNYADVLDTLIKPDGSETKLFNKNPVLVLNQLKAAKTSDYKGKAFTTRMVLNKFFQCYYSGKLSTTSGTFTRADVEAVLDASQYINYNVNLSGIAAGAAAGGVSGAAGAAGIAATNTVVTALNSLFNNINDKFYKIAKDSICGTNKGKNSLPTTFFDWGNNDSLSNESGRMILVYTVSDIMRQLSGLLNVIDGQEFGTTCTLAYMTYLDWYGVVKQTTVLSGTNDSSEFSKDIFDESSDMLKVDPGTIINAISDEEKEEQILDMTYLLLHPEQGREYRQEIMFNGLTDWLYETYMRIVYGESTKAGGTSLSSTSRSNSGFLHVETYEQNFFTSTFLKYYSDIAVWVIVTCIAAMVILGMLASKRGSWYIMTLFTIINVVLILPASGDIIPTIVGSSVQRMFQGKMDSWAMEEALTNAAIEEQYSSNNTLYGIEGDEAQELLSLLNTLSTLNTDTSLMLKQDISQKITQELGGVYTNIQEIQSARWILPMIMQQFSSNDGSADYVYVKLDNVFNDATNMYWYYMPNYSETVTKATATSSQQDVKYAADTEKYSSRNTSYHLDAGDTDFKLDPVDGKEFNYKSYAYTAHAEDYDQLVHTYCYILPDVGTTTVDRKLAFGDDYSDYKNVDSWQKYIDKAVDGGLAVKASWATNKADGLESYINKYDRLDRDTFHSGYGYLLTTQQPYYYFLANVEDSFNASDTVGKIIGRLQGGIATTTDGKEVRSSFMHGTLGSDLSVDNYESAADANAVPTEHTGYVRDVCDLQELFTNVIPYLYEMQLIAGGFDGKSGILGDDKIESSNYYDGMNQSWLYRCNWATKLMENPDFNKASEVIDAAGNKSVIVNMMWPQAYPEDRPMVFSEAQMYAEGLTPDKLTLVELKCIEVNKRVVDDWTLLINYAGDGDLTKEIIYRQMAFASQSEFMQEFSSSSWLNTKYTLYPQTIDLRYLSFNSIMTMLMLNVSKDKSYIYNGTMKTILSNSDIGTAILLLVVAFVCAYIIPLMRVVLLALIFYLGALHILRSLFSSNSYKCQIVGSGVVLNTIFCIVTIVYYSFFSLLVSITSSDDVLSIGIKGTHAGNPVWMLIVVLLVSIVYCVFMGFMIVFCVKRYTEAFDIARNVITTSIENLGESLSNAGSSIKQHFNDFMNDNSSTTNSTSSTVNSINGTGIRNANSQSVSIDKASNQTLRIENDNSSEESVWNEDMNSNPYLDDATEEVQEIDNSDMIDAEIEAGSQIKD